MCVARRANRETDLVGGERVEGVIRVGGSIGLVDRGGGGKQCGRGHIVG